MGHYMMWEYKKIQQRKTDINSDYEKSFNDILVGRYTVLHSYPFTADRDGRLILCVSSAADISDLQSLSSGHGLAALCRCRDQLENSTGTLYEAN